jgi:predicted esterase
MGGAGTLYLGVKHADIWAAIAAIAPAAFWVEPQSLATVPDMPVFMVHGTVDTVVPVDVSHRFVDVLKSTGMDYEFQELPDADHGTVIPEGMPGIFAFFGKHAKP